MEREELKTLIAAIVGLPPNGVVYSMLNRELPGVSDEEIEAALNELLAEDRIMAPVNGWIIGVSEQGRRIKHALDNMTADDYAWLSGSGRFAQ